MNSKFYNLFFFFQLLYMLILFSVVIYSCYFKEVIFIFIIIIKYIYIYIYLKIKNQMYIYNNIIVNFNYIFESIAFYII